MDDNLSHLGTWAASIVALVLAGLAWVKRSGANDVELVALKTSQDQIWKALDDHRAESNRKHGDIASDLQTYRIKMAEEYVSKNDLRESEGRIISHINMVLSAVGCPYGRAVTNPSDQNQNQQGRCKNG